MVSLKDVDLLCGRNKRAKDRELHLFVQQSIPLVRLHQITGWLGVRAASIVGEWGHAQYLYLRTRIDMTTLPLPRMVSRMTMAK